MTSRQLLQEAGICPDCLNERLYGDEKVCELCKAKKYATLRDFRKKHPDYDKNKRKITYHDRVENHQCTQCGVQLEDGYAYKMCQRCLVKNRNSLRVRRARNYG